MGMNLTGAEDSFKAGDIVIVRRGKYTGTLFVAIGMEGKSRVLITNGVDYTVDRPKKKNVIHLQKTLMSLKDVAGRVAGGKPLDNGWLKQKITAISDNSDTSCRQGG